MYSAGGLLDAIRQLGRFEARGRNVADERQRDHAVGPHRHVARHFLVLPEEDAEHVLRADHEIRAGGDAGRWRRWLRRLRSWLRPRGRGARGAGLGQRRQRRKRGEHQSGCHKGAHESLSPANNVLTRANRHVVSAWSLDSEEWVVICWAIS